MLLTAHLLDLQLKYTNCLHHSLIKFPFCFSGIMFHQLQQCFHFFIVCNLSVLSSHFYFCILFYITSLIIKNLQILYSYFTIYYLEIYTNFFILPFLHKFYCTLLEKALTKFVYLVFSIFLKKFFHNYKPNSFIASS